MADTQKSKVFFGIKELYIAKMNADGTTYGTPFKVNGVVGLNADPEGDTTKFYADGVVYYTATANQGYSGDLELACTPEEFLMQILGQIKDSNGVIFESATDKVSDFAIMFQADGDVKNRRFCYYNCHAERPSRENNTIEESVEVGTETLAITMMPRVSDGLVKAVLEDDGSETYRNWFNAPVEKAVI